MSPRGSWHDTLRDRYANIEFLFLLQRIERHDGVTLLATNREANLDYGTQSAMNRFVSPAFAS